MNKIIVYKNILGDTRTADRMPTKEEFYLSNWLHKKDVNNLAREFSIELRGRCGNHDWTKLQEPYASKFYKLMKATIEDGADFYSGEWANLHYNVLERHHLNSYCPDDVDLFDVLEMIFDSISAGMARSGSVYPVKISNETMQKAVTNTVNYLIENIEIAESEE